MLPGRPHIFDIYEGAGEIQRLIIARSILGYTNRDPGRDFLRVPSRYGYHICCWCLLALAKLIPATDWQSAIFQQLAKLVEIDDHPEEPWRARRPTAAAYKAAVSLISQITDDSLPLPRIAPDREGGLQLEWEKGSCAVEISISPGGSLELLRSKAGRDTEEGRVGISAARDVLSRLARI